MELDELLAFVDECDADDHQFSALLHEGVASTTATELKKLQRPETRGIAALQTQVVALTLELEEIKQSRSGGNTLQPAKPSPWLIEADRQSRLRSAALEENERLKAKVQAQRCSAERLVKVLKRCSAHKVLEMVLGFQRDAELRTQRRFTDAFDEFDHAFIQTDEILADAEMATLSPFCFDARFRQQNGTRGFLIELRRRMCVARDRDTTSEAYWRFSPHESFSKRFIFEQTSSYANETKGLTFVFQPKQGPSQTRFHGHYLLRRYTTKDRVVIVWKMLVESDGSLNSLQLQVSGRGWAVIEGSSANGKPTPLSCCPTTNIQAVARFYPESKLGTVLKPDQIHQDADLRALVDFVTFAGEGYAAFPTQMALNQ